MRNHEQGVADKFNAFLRRAGERQGIAVHDFSLGGQDRDAGADYLLSDASRFALVEFKFREADIRDEVDKPRRRALCQSLPRRPDMEQRHDRCHFIVWSDPHRQRIIANIYRKEVCNCRIFGHAAKLEDLEAEVASRTVAEQFAQEFLDPGLSLRSLDLLNFEAYLKWLMQDVSGASASTLELLASDPSRPNELVLVILQSVGEAYQWMQKHRMRDEPQDDPDDSPSPFRPFR
jgi:hypothetical protein